MPVQRKMVEVKWRTIGKLESQPKFSYNMKIPWWRKWQPAPVLFFFFFFYVKHILLGVFMLGQSKQQQQRPNLNRFSFNMTMCTWTTENRENPQINVFNKLQLLLKMVCWDFKETVQ